MYRTWEAPKPRKERWQASKYCQLNTPPNFTFTISCKLKCTCVQPEAFARTVSSCSSCSLAGWGLGDGCDHQWFDGAVRIVGPQLYKCAVNDKHNPIYGNGSLSDVRGHHDLQEIGRKNNNKRGYLKVSLIYQPQRHNTILQRTHNFYIK